MKLEIVSPEKIIYDGEVNYAEFPGAQGSFGVLRNHAPLLSTLKKGTIKVKEPDGKEQAFDIPGGVVEVLKNRIIVMAG